MSLAKPTPPTTVELVPLRPGAELPWDLASQSAKPAPANERDAYDQLLQRRQSVNTDLDMQVTGRLQKVNDRWSLMVRSFADDPSTPSATGKSGVAMGPASGEPPPQTGGPVGSGSAIGQPTGAPATVAGGLTALAGGVIALITVFTWVHWSPQQTTLVSIEAGAIIALATAIFAHLRPGTQKEPVALAATFTATVAATLGLANGFGWVHWTPDQLATVGSLVSAIVGVVAALIARRKVTPVDDITAQQRR